MVNAGQYPVDADADGSVRMLAAKESHVVPSFCRNTDGKRMRERMRVSFVWDTSDGVAPQSSTNAHCNSHGKYCILPLSWIYDIPIIVHHLIQKTINPTMILTTYSPSMLGTTTPIIIVVVRAVQYHHRYPFVRFPKYGTPGPSYQFGYFSLEGVFVLSYRIQTVVIKGRMLRSFGFAAGRR